MQPAVLKHREAYELAMHRQEMQERYATGYWRRDPDPNRQPSFIKEMFDRVSTISNNSDTDHVDSN